MEMFDQKRDPSFSGIQKVGAAVVFERRVIALRKVNQPTSEYYMAGGKIEEGETQGETLQRELDEELGVMVKNSEFLGTFEDVAVFEGTPIRLHAYYVEVEGKPTPANEVKEYKWFDSHWDEGSEKLSSILAKEVIPELKARGYVD